MMKVLTIENRQTKLFTTIYSNEKQEAVILLHGGPGVPDDLTNVAESLTGKFQVISFHHRGTKLSPSNNKDYSIESYLTDIDSVSEYFNIQKFHLFGHSWGGLYAQIYAEHNAAKILSLFLCSPSSGTGKQWKETEAEVMRFNKSKCSFPEFLKMGFNSLQGMFGNDKAYQKLFEQVIKNYNKGFLIKEKLSFDLQNVKAAPVNATRKQLLKYPLLKNNPTPNFKITVTYGASDIYGDSKKYVRERYPTATFINIENCGHLPWLHNSPAFSKILEEHF